MADIDLLNLATTQFSTNVELLLQQKGSLLRNHLRTGMHVGKQASPVNQIAAIDARAPAGRFSPKERTPESFVRRWVFPFARELDQLIDSFDELQTIVDPKSEYVTNAAYAIGRAYDDAIINASFGTSQLGVDEGAMSSETFNTASTAATSNPGFSVWDTYGAGSNSVGLTVDKLIEVKRTLRHYHNDLDSDPLTLVIGSQQEADLLNQVEVVSKEFNDRPALVDGSVKRFLGFDIVVTERLGTTSAPPSSSGATVRQCIAFVKSGMYLGIWQDMVNRASIRNDLSSEPWDLYTKAMFGATRLQPGKVIQVLAKDTTGTDINP